MKFYQNDKQRIFIQTWQGEMQITAGAVRALPADLTIENIVKT